MSTQPFTSEHDQPSSIVTDRIKEYQVQNMSNWSAFIFVLATLFILPFAIGIALGLGGSAIVFIFSMGAATGLIIYLFRYLQQKILVTVSKDSICIQYLHSPFFIPARDMNLVPADVKSYKFDNFNRACFILYLKDGRRFRAAIGNVGKTKAIEQMAEHIIAVVTDKQYSPANTGTPPRRRATYAEGTTGLVLAIVCIAAIIAMGIAIMFFPENHNTSDTVRGIGVMATCLAFVLHVFNLRRKARKDKDEQAGGNSPAG